MNRVRQPFNREHFAMVAASRRLATMTSLPIESQGQRARGSYSYKRKVRAAGLLEYIPSAGNFIAVRVGDAARVYGSLLRQGVIVRPIAGYGMPEHLRVTVGTRDQNGRFLESLARALGRLAGERTEMRRVCDA